MRRIIALLLSALIIAATAEGAAPRCFSPTGSLGNGHSCCDDQPALSPAPPPCCAISQAAQPGPIERQTLVSPAATVCDASRTGFGSANNMLRKLLPQSPLHSITSSVPIYLQQLSLLI